MSDECYCYSTDVCSSCRKAQEEMYIELESLRAWKEKASVLLKHEWTTLKFNADMFEENQPDMDKKRLAILTDLLEEK